MELSHHYQNLVERAEAFRHFVSLVKHLPPELTSALPTLTDLPSRLPPGKTLSPRLSLDGHKLCCNGLTVDLTRRPLMRKLFQLFCESPSGLVRREQVERHVYGVSEADPVSDRMRECMQQNVIKLISRARSLLEAHFKAEGVEWICIDHEAGGWRLAKVVSRI